MAPAKVTPGSAAPKVAAAAVGASGIASSSAAPRGVPSDSYAKPAIGASQTKPSQMSSAVSDEPQVETFEPQNSAPKIAVDPLMAEGKARASTGVSFSEMTELPPLKEYVAPPPPTPPAEASFEPVQHSRPAELKINRKVDEKPKVQPREVAQKAIKEIREHSGKTDALFTSRGRSADFSHRTWRRPLYPLAQTAMTIPAAAVALP